MDPESLTPLAAFAAGLGSSVHCAGMCAPLVCAVKTAPAQYHASRVVSYSACGALAGGCAAVIPGLPRHPFPQAAQWALAAVLLLLAAGLDRRMPQPLWVSRILFRFRLRNTLGWVTPLLPCGPLWLILGAAFVSARWSAGALLGGAFAAGTIPLFLLLQHGWMQSLRAASPRFLPRFQQAVLVLSASVLVWRSLTPHACCH